LSQLAVIGGSGFASMQRLELLREERPGTPYGPTSAPVLYGRLGDLELLFLPRHGAEHSIPPHRINYRANLWALKDLGAERVVGLAAVGGIGTMYGPGVVAVPDQLIDYTYDREHTCYDGDSGEVVHVDFTKPYCEDLRQTLLAAARAAAIDFVAGGTYGATQGPRLETAAEVRRLERDGCHLVGMTGMPEAALARELGLCYACCAFVVNWAAGKAGGELRMEDIEAAVRRGAETVGRLLAAIPS
jgi:5'-deoxy-5'-methylthioadenosine phosphorylase